jgi:hypothetical protein
MLLQGSSGAPVHGCVSRKFSASQLNLRIAMLQHLTKVSWLMERILYRLVEQEDH